MNFQKDAAAQERVSVNLAKMKKGGLNFEVSIDPDLAASFIEGEQVDIKDIVKAEHIFHDMQKGEIASDDKMTELFGTSDPLAVAEILLTKGEIQFTADYRQKLRDRKRKRIITLIHRNGCDPRTGAPHPPNRIEAAFEEAKVRIDERKKAEDQIQEILRKLQPVLPIRFEQKRISVVVPAEYAGKCSGALRDFGTLLNEKWNNDGSWSATIEIPGGMEEELHAKLNDLTKGTATATKGE